MSTIYGEYEQTLQDVLQDILNRLEAMDVSYYTANDDHLYEHISYRIKSDESMREKCRRKGLEETPQSAIHEIKDAIGVRIVCSFVDDIYEIVRRIGTFEGCRIVEEKDYIRHNKPNGYRSFHLILEILNSHEDVAGMVPGHFYAELQLRTIAMDSWAALEHKMKYKKDIRNQELIVSELKRCADELASCDISMQTIRDLIRQSGKGEER
ncbi:MAG: GTP pyrophosphokinase family protein [Lachnospiraceae bacterium]|nr:GTP pyrophosphokinase family protein [Lachnospiraceae bacterium]